MIGKWVPHCIRNNPRMTSAAEFVDRLFQHELLVSGMRVMTDDTPPPDDDSVDIGHTILGFLGHESLFISMTSQAKVQGALFQELIAVVLTMRIMAESTPPDPYGAVDELLGQPAFFPCVAAEAKCLGLLRRKPDFQWVDGLLMACKALLVDRCAMPPGTLIGDISMATVTRGSFRQSHGRESLGLHQLMAILTAGG